MPEVTPTTSAKPAAESTDTGTKPTYEGRVRTFADDKPPNAPPVAVYFEKEDIERRKLLVAGKTHDANGIPLSSYYIP